MERNRTLLYGNAQPPQLPGPSTRLTYEEAMEQNRRSMYGNDAPSQYPVPSRRLTYEEAMQRSHIHLYGYAHHYLPRSNPGQFGMTLPQQNLRPDMGERVNDDDTRFGLASPVPAFEVQPLRPRPRTQPSPSRSLSPHTRAVSWLADQARTRTQLYGNPEEFGMASPQWGLSPPSAERDGGIGNNGDFATGFSSTGRKWKQDLLQTPAQAYMATQGSTEWYLLNGVSVLRRRCAIVNSTVCAPFPEPSFAISKLTIIRHIDTHCTLWRRHAS